MALESGSHTHAAVPSGSPQEGKAEEIECTTTRDPPPSLAASADDEMCRQELSPLSSPERLGELGACTDKATPLATTTVLHEGMKQPKEAAEGTEGLSHNQASVVSLKGGRVGLSGGSVEATAASEQQTKARDQAKRLALEVARLRSSLRATTSELNTERSARVRIEVRTNPHDEPIFNFQPLQHSTHLLFNLLTYMQSTILHAPPRVGSQLPG